MKPKEINTDTLVKELFTLKDVSIIYKTESTDEDANWDKECLYKTKCKEIITKNDINIFLDIFIITICVQRKHYTHQE